MSTGQRDDEFEDDWTVIFASALDEKPMVVGISDPKTMPATTCSSLSISSVCTDEGVQGEISVDEILELPVHLEDPVTIARYVPEPYQSEPGLLDSPTERLEVQLKGSKLSTSIAWEVLPFNQIRADKYEDCEECETANTSAVEWPTLQDAMKIRKTRPRGVGTMTQDKERCGMGFVA